MRPVNRVFDPSRQCAPTCKRGAVAVFTLVMLVVLVGFAALTIDVGALYNTRADLQNAADAAAMAGAGMYASPAMTAIRMETASSDEWSKVTASIENEATMVSALHTSFGGGRTVLEVGDITIGYLNLENTKGSIDTSVSPSLFNAVHVLVRRDQEGPNGPVNLFFSGIFGKYQSNVSASAVAVYDDRFSGYAPESPNAAALWPFTIHEDQYDSWVAQGSDLFSYSEDTDSVHSGSDGVNEVRLYPDKLAPGNYGLLNIGTPNQSTSALEEQIKMGVSGDDLEIETGSSELTFYDEHGNPTTYTISGNPGLKSALEAAVQSRVGDIVGFFLHNNVQQQGSNVVYTITKIRFGRVMFVKLSGGDKKRGLYVQPVTYTGPGVITGPWAPSSGVAGRVVLAQ